MDFAQGGPVGISGDDLLAVDLGMKDLVDDPEDAPETDHDRPAETAHEEKWKQHDPSAGQMGFVERERVDRAGGQGKLVERKAAKGAADVLLTVAADELGDLRPEPGVNLAVALGVVGQKVDGRELDRLEECPGLSAGRAFGPQRAELAGGQPCRSVKPRSTRARHAGVESSGTQTSSGRS